jgi:hypothetical protein
MVTSLETRRTRPCSNSVKSARRPAGRGKGSRRLDSGFGVPAVARRHDRSLPTVAIKASPQPAARSRGSLMRWTADLASIRLRCRFSVMSTSGVP